MENFSFKERAVYFKKLVEILLNEEEHYAQIMTEEMGRPISSAIIMLKMLKYFMPGYFLPDANQGIQLHLFLRYYQLF
jgi:acyl-CoA reductase-like NAD-dependent aldehyde dehydrogenase